MRESKVYSSNKAVLADNVGRRLENFFWRIWGSERLRQRISGTQVNIQFDIINEGGYIRTTPTSSPRSSKSLTAYYKEARRRTPPVTPPASEPNESILSTEAGNFSTKKDAKRRSPKGADAGASAASKGPRDSRSLPDRSAPKGNIFTPSAGHRHGPESSSRASFLPKHIDPKDSSITPTPMSPIAVLDQSEGTSKENKRTTQATTWRPPILKKGSSGSSRSAMSAKIVSSSSAEPQAGTSPEILEASSPTDESGLSIQAGSSTYRRPTATRFNEEVAVSIPKPSSSVSRTTGERSSRLGGDKPGRRNPIVVASSAASRTKPTFIRQRSSSGTPKGSLSRSSSNQNLAKSPRSLAASTSLGSRSGLEFRESPRLPSAKRSRGASPHPSKQRGKASPDPSPSQQLEDSDPDQPDQDEPQRSGVGSRESEGKKKESPGKSTELSKPLIDPDFRAKFIDRSRASQRSLTDLSAFNRKSSAAVATSASYQATGMMDSVQAPSTAGRSRGREAFTNVTAPLKAPAPAGPEAESEDTTAPLPRTKSQLTLLLEREKVRSENLERRTRHTDPGPNNPSEK